MSYSDAELRVMEYDAQLAIDHGADGLVFGALTGIGAVDVAACERLMKIAKKSKQIETIFHRAFDVVADPQAALEQLIDLGFTRVLTSGRASAAIDGVEEIRRTIERARDRIEILPGCGINADNVEQILLRTGAKQVHLSASRNVIDSSTAANSAVQFSAGGDGHRVTDEAAVRAVRRVLDELCQRSK
jgi:copper homeostasis protein